MVKCSFSGKEIPPGKGIMYVKSDGKVLYFSDRKCEKNMLQLKRKPQNIRWTEEGVKHKQERMAAMKHQEEEEKSSEAKKEDKTSDKKVTKKEDSAKKTKKE